MLAMSDRLRLRYRLWKFRALCWVLRRLRARGGRMARPERARGHAARRGGPQI